MNLYRKLFPMRKRDDSAEDARHHDYEVAIEQGRKRVNAALTSVYYESSVLDAMNSAMKSLAKDTQKR